MADEPREPSGKGPGRLVLVATPIGNLGDLAPRAADALDAADVVLAEDTRRTRKLLTHAGISAKLLSYHRGNERSRQSGLLDRIESGEIVALVSDAGMPLISDPGASLVHACIARDIKVECIPGPSAGLAALAVSGLPADRFAFEGFLPRTKGPRRRRLDSLAGDDRTLVIFEAPHRLRAMLADSSLAFGAERPAAICREITKLHEEIWRGSLGQAVEHWGTVEPRGEFVVVIGGAAGSGRDVEGAAIEAIEAALNAGNSARDAARAGESAGLARNRAYVLAVELAKSKAATIGAGTDARPGSGKAGGDTR